MFHSKTNVEESYTPTKPVVKFEMELSESMQNQYGKQFKGGPTPGNNVIQLMFLKSHTSFV